MKSLFKGRSGYLLGRALTVWSALAAILILISMLALPMLAGSVIDVAEVAFISASDLVEELAQIVGSAQDTILQTSTALNTSSSALEQAQNNLEEIGPLLESVQALLGEDLPSVIIATQRGLDSAQSGARAMDQVLRALSSIRFLTGVNYSPEQPLDEALQDVAESLVPMPEGLISVAEKTGKFNQAVDDVEPELNEVIDEIGKMSASLRSMSLSISPLVERMTLLADTLEGQAQTIGHKVWIGVVIAEIFMIQLGWLQLISGYVGGKLVHANS
ncbi:MAG: hypothetical protein PVI81_09445 [Anaerolineales bacterium]|jgi:hypothetical protein